MYIVKKTNLRIQDAYQNVIVGRPDASEVVGRAGSLVDAIGLSIEANAKKADHETCCRIENEAGEIVIGANEMQLAATAIKPYSKAHWNGMGAPTVYEQAGDDLSLSGLRERMDDHYYGDVQLVEKVASAAATLGKRGGSVTSKAKSAAARANGRKGGRPRKVQNK